MSADTATQTDFGEVSRIKGVVFQYVTLAASLVGIVALGILLAYVSIDAFGLRSASPAWYAVYAATLFAPAAAFLWYTRRNPAAGRAGFRMVTAFAGGTMTAIAAVIVLTLIVGPEVWLAHVSLVVLLPVVLVGYGRLNPGATWTGTLAPLSFLAGVVLVSIDDVLLAFGQQLAAPFDVVTAVEDGLLTAGELLGTPGIYFLTLTLPVAAYVGRRVADSGTRRAGLLAGGAIAAVTIAGVPVIDPIEFVDRGTWAILVVALLVPVGLTTRGIWRTPAERPGLLVPVILVGGALLGRTVVYTLGIDRPEPWLDWQFLTTSPSFTPAATGFYPAIIGSVFIIVLVAVLTFIFGVGAAIYLEEYAPSSGPVGKFTRLIQVNISNLAGVPSIVYGLLGLALFLKLLGMKFGTVIVAAMTLSLLILPIVIISAQEALRSVPDDLRQASYGMGATQWQTIRNVVLPEAMPGIFTGTILALGRAIGETAPLLLIGIPNFGTMVPGGPFERTLAMPMLIFEWAFFPEDAWRYGVVAASVVALLVVLLTMNSVAIVLRNKYQTEA